MQIACECVSSIHVIMESVRYVMFHVIFNQHMYVVAAPGSCFEIPSETPVELLFFSIAYNYLKEMLMRSFFFLSNLLLAMALFKWTRWFQNGFLFIEKEKALIKLYNKSDLA